MTFEVSDYCNMADYYPGMSGGGLLSIPFNGVSIEADTTIVFEFDIENCIEVYDNNTPSDKSDDIVVMADNYWNRFTLRVIQ